MVILFGFTTITYYRPVSHVCGSTYGSGWWYDDASCLDTKLTGDPSLTNPAVGHGIYWSDLPGAAIDKVLMRFTILTELNTGRPTCLS